MAGARWEVWWSWTCCACRPVRGEERGGEGKPSLQAEWSFFSPVLTLSPPRLLRQRRRPGRGADQRSGRRAAGPFRQPRRKGDRDRPPGPAGKKKVGGDGDKKKRPLPPPPPLCTFRSSPAPSSMGWAVKFRATFNSGPLLAGVLRPEWCRTPLFCQRPTSPLLCRSPFQQRRWAHNHIFFTSPPPPPPPGRHAHGLGCGGGGRRHH